MKRKFMALLISFSMIFSAMVSIPAKVFAEDVDIPSFADFGLNDDRRGPRRVCRPAHSV